MNTQSSARRRPLRAGRRRSETVTAVLAGVLVLVALLAAALLGLIPIGGSPEAATPAPSPAVVATPSQPPLTGLSPPAIAAEMSRRAFPAGEAPNVLLARESPSADALAASGLQGQLSAPLLLTASDQLSPETVAELQRLDDSEIHMLGGTAALSPQLEQQLVASGHGIHRHAGSTGAETAVDIASRHFTAARTAVLVSMGAQGSDPAEAVVNALPASSLAAAERLPVLLTGPGQLPLVTAQHLRDSAIERVLVVGDATVVSDQVITAIQSLGLEVVRLAAGDRFSNAVAVAQHRGFPDAASASVVVLAQGAVDGAWPASFIGAINTGRFVGAPTVLAQGGTLPEPTRQFLTTGEPVSTFLLCAPGVPASACAEGRTLLQGS